LQFEGDVKEPPCLMEPLVGLWVRGIRDVLEVAGSDRHVVGYAGEAQYARSPCAVVIVEPSGLLLLKLLPSTLELYFDDVEVRLPRLQTRCLLLKVVCVVGGTQVRRHEFGGIIGGYLTVDVEALMGREVVADVVKIILWPIPRDDFVEVAQGIYIGPRGTQEDGAMWRLRLTRCSSSSWNAVVAFWIPYGMYDR
jgi:hypothetical protein